ncbi:HIT family protein [Streptococcus sp. sy004]|uniref:HIT family protein n=1 Tax=Streptococcus sp. sy004 TaxID=2600149 RepID=UPI0011B54048|nr:HIT family protein [Streptococcus sp. sy004]TWT09867.1 HIT family protein [Streptococcus sp. sy004]
MQKCIFCQIVAGDIPASKVYEDEHVLAFLDITQVTKGHTLVIPKKHVRNLLDMDSETAQQVFAPIPQLARRLQTVTGASGLNVLNNSEAVAGQTVFHAHIHLIPRFNDEDCLTIDFKTNEPDFEQLSQLAKAITDEVEK